MEYVSFAVNHLDSQTLKISWYVDFLQYISCFKITLYHIKDEELDFAAAVCPLLVAPSGNHVFEELTRGEEYQVILTWEYNDEEYEAKTEVFRAHYGPGEMELLLNTAKNYISGQHMKSISSFYRSKSAEYYMPIRLSWSKVERAYLKDMSGDKACPMNEKVSGLFFAARTQEGFTSDAATPPGTMRFHVEAKTLFTRTSKVYFADFYCAYRQHCVVLVLTQPGTFADVYCSKHLVQLNKQNNVFITRDSFGIIRLNQSSHVRIQIYYTDDVNLDLGYFTANPNTCTKKGRLYSEVSPKNESCFTCNLYPQIDLLQKLMKAIHLSDPCDDL